MIDPRTGETRLVDVGPRRLRTIFDTNLRMAHARGRWERIEALKEDLPWLRYVATLDSRTRDDHRRWHGVILRVDDPWWQSHYPPNGWRCRCAVQQLSESEARRRGGRTPPPKEGTREWTNARTGETIRVPVGIDPGFERNVGTLNRPAKAREMLAERIAQALPDFPDAARLLDRVDGAATDGRIVREEITRAIGGEFRAAPFRAETLRRLRAERGAGSETALVNAAESDHADLVDLVSDASRTLPASWVRRANEAGPVRAKWETGSSKGSYSLHDRTISISDDIDPSSMGGAPGTALHEYVHHLQSSLPGFQAIFRAEHLRRTTAPLGKGKSKSASALGKRDRMEHSKYGGGARYRADDYVDDYFGRDYGENVQRSLNPEHAMPDGDAMETPTRAFQLALGGHDYWLEKMAWEDPRMLDIVLGLLFRWDPP